MNEKELREKLNHAVKTCLTGLEGDPWLVHNILSQTKKTKRAESRLSIGSIFAIALIFIATTGLAAVLLSTIEIIEDEVIPLATQNDNITLQEDFANKELAYIVSLAQDNNIILSEDILTALQGGYGYSEQSTIMELACSAFGPYENWTIEQQYWFGEVMVAIGWQQNNSACLPKGEDITYQQALELVNDHVINEYGYSVLDEARWNQSVSYKSSSLSNEEPHWCFVFSPLKPQDAQFEIILTADGSIVSSEAFRMDTDLGSSIIEAYQVSFGPFSDWTPEIWAAFGEEIRTSIPDDKPSWVFQNTKFILPPSNGINQEQAEEIALNEIGREFTTIGSVVCCMDGEIPIWKIETHTKMPADIGSGEFTAIWNLEINALTGNILDKRQFEVGKNKDFLTRWVPWSVYENIFKWPDFLEHNE